VNRVRTTAGNRRQVIYALQTEGTRCIFDEEGREDFSPFRVRTWVTQVKRAPCGSAAEQERFTLLIRGITPATPSEQSVDRQGRVQRLREEGVATWGAGKDAFHQPHHEHHVRWLEAAGALQTDTSWGCSPGLHFGSFNHCAEFSQPGRGRKLHTCAAGVIDQCFEQPIKPLKGPIEEKRMLHTVPAPRSA
jgi:hypothetical protein